MPKTYHNTYRRNIAGLRSTIAARKFPRALLAALMTSTALAGAAPAWADTVVWRGTIDGSYVLLGNWDSAFGVLHVPTGNDIASITDGTAPNQPVIAVGQTFSTRQVDVLAAGATNVPTLTVNGVLGLGDPGSAGTLNIAGTPSGGIANLAGTVIVSGVGAQIGAAADALNGADPALSMAVSSGGNGTLRIENGGTGTFSSLCLACGGGTFAGTGLTEVTGAGSSLDITSGAGQISIGAFGAGGGTGTLRVLNGGEVTMAGGVGDLLGVGSGIEVSGTDGSGNASHLLWNGTLTVRGDITVTDGALAEFGTLVHNGFSNPTSLTISNGARVNQITGEALNWGFNQQQAVLITGVGTQLNVNGALGIDSGNIGDGSTDFVIADGAVVNVGSASQSGLAFGEERLLSVTDSTLNMTGGLQMNRGNLQATNATLNFGSGEVTMGTFFDGNTLSLFNSDITATLITTNGSGSGVGNVINLGGTASGPAGAVGAFNVAAVSLNGLGGGAEIVINHTATDYNIASMFSGGGIIRHIAGDTIFSGVSTSFQGQTHVTGGMLSVNGTLGGALHSMTVSNAATLGGSGTIGGTTFVNAGGAIAPGNSIGMLTVGNIEFAAGSIYTVELNDGGFINGINNDLIDATGTATILGGTVHVTPENGTDTGTTYTPGTYTILKAAGGVTGTFTTLTDDYALLDFILDYSTTDEVNLTSALTGGGTGTCPPGLTFNQNSTCGGVLSIGSGTLHTAVINLSNADLPGALDQLSGEVHASAKTALLEDSRFAREAALDRLRVALGGADANAGQVRTETPEGTTIWAQGIGGWSQWNGDGNAATLNRGIGGLFMGADAEIVDDVYLGLMGGYSRSGVSVADRMSSGTVDSYTLGAYAGGTWDAFSLKGGAAYSWHNLNTSRSVAFTGFADSLSASYNVRTFQAYTEAAYTIDAGNARFEPFANLAFVNLNADGYTETGGAAALTAAGQVVNATFTTLGIRGETRIDLGASAATLSGGLGWRHAFGNTPTATHSFAGGNAFTVAGVPMARDALVLDAGFNVNLTDNATFGLTYNVQFGSNLADHSAKASLNVKF